MTEKWTPGEWLVDATGDTYYVEVEPGFAIAEAYSKDDAHLIAAAPDLYRALEDATDILAALTFATIRIRGQYYPRGEIVESARAALASARGEA